MCFVARAGALHLVRDQHLIFHGCVPVDDAGAALPMPAAPQRAVQNSRAERWRFVHRVSGSPRSAEEGAGALTAAAGAAAGADEEAEKSNKKSKCAAPPL